MNNIFLRKTVEGVNKIRRNQYSRMAKTCYYPNITGLEAEKLLLEKGYEGSYLTRPSQKTPGDYSLSVRRRDKVIHVRIQNHGDYYDLYGGEKFANLAELIQFYSENPDQLKETDGSIIALGQPFYTEEMEEVSTEKWYHGEITGKEAENLLISQGQHGSYLVRISTRTPGNYVLTARIHDQTTHLTIAYSDSQYIIGSKGFPTLKELVKFYTCNRLVDGSNRVVELLKPFGTTFFFPTKIRERVSELEKQSIYTYGKSGFYEEFEQLQRQENNLYLNRQEGSKDKNRSKNRFKNILPFDQTMVVLKDPSSSYVNANYINGETPGSETQYIATQGCLPNTINDFWLMVWQENSLIIVMITKEIERGRSKCSHYWPGSDGPLIYGGITIMLMLETTHPHFIVRHFSLLKGSEQRNVFQYQFKAWPEHGVPQDAGIFLGFLEEVNLKAKELEDAGCKPGPTVVHCSAGIGRTGTYIAIDILISLIQYQGWDKEIDIQRSVQLLRQYRSGMVQNEQQYKLIYYTLLHYMEANSKLIESSDAVTTGTDIAVYENMSSPMKACESSSPLVVSGKSQFPFKSQ